MTVAQHHGAAGYCPLAVDPLPAVLRVRRSIPPGGNLAGVAASAWAHAQRTGYVGRDVIAPPASLSRWCPWLTGHGHGNPPRRVASDRGSVDLRRHTVPRSRATIHDAAPFIGGVSDRTVVHDGATEGEHFVDAVVACDGTVPVGGTRDGRQANECYSADQGDAD